MYIQMHIHVCRLGNISLHGHTHTVLHVWFSHVTHISHWRTEVHSTIRILVLVHTQHFRCVELVEDADQRTTVPVVSHTTSIVTLTSQILQSCKLYFLHTYVRICTHIPLEHTHLNSKYTLYIHTYVLTCTSNPYIHVLCYKPRSH